jgi:hypothetical protein
LSLTTIETLVKARMDADGKRIHAASIFHISSQLYPATRVECSGSKNRFVLDG